PRKYVLNHLEELVIKPAFPRPNQKVEFPASMTAAARAALAARIEATPEEYVAQEQVALSTAPVRTETGFAPRHIVLRMFAAWNGNGYTGMPGGVSGVPTEDRSLVVSMQHGGGSKDTWVLAERGSASEETQPSYRVQEPIIGPRPPGEVPSRVADNL